MTKTQETTNITLTREELAALIHESVVAERQNTFWRRRIKPCLVSVWKSRFAWLLAGMVLMLPFVSGGISFEKTFHRLNPVEILKTDSPTRLAKDAPADSMKRKTISKAYRATADLIRTKTIADKEEALTSLSVQTANVISDPMWNKTIDRINNIIVPTKDLDSLAGKLNEIAEAFEQ